MVAGAFQTKGRGGVKVARAAFGKRAVPATAPALRCGDLRHCEAEDWWACRDLNPEPSDYESPALTVELQALPWARPGLRGLAVRHSARCAVARLWKPGRPRPDRGAPRGQRADALVGADAGMMEVDVACQSQWRNASRIGDPDAPALRLAVPCFVVRHDRPVGAASARAARLRRPPRRPMANPLGPR